LTLDPKKALIVVGLVALAVYHVATGQYSMTINDVLTIVAATHYGPVMNFLTGVGVKLPSDPLAEASTVVTTTTTVQGMPPAPTVIPPAVPAATTFTISEPSPPVL
jgi:hypothetical protein